MDVGIDPAHAGLHSASKVRMKLFTLDNRMIAQKVGALSEIDRRAVGSGVKKLLPV